MAAYDVSARALVTPLAGATGLPMLLLRIYDHQRHVYEWARAERPDVGCVFPSLRQVANSAGSSEFSIYDMLKFTYNIVPQNVRTYYYAESLSRTTTTITDYSVVKAALQFTPNANKTYAIFWNAIIDIDTVVRQGCRLYHQTTATILQHYELLPSSTPLVATEKYSVGGVAIYTAGAFPAAQQFEIRVGMSGAATVGIQEACILALELIDNVDVWASSPGVSTSSSITYTSKVSLSWTPASAGDYLMLGAAAGRSSVGELRAQLNVNSGTLVNVMNMVDWQDNVEQNLICPAYRFSNVSTLQTAAIQFSSNGTSAVEIQQAHAVALRLDRFIARYWGEDRTQHISTSATYASSASTGAFTPTADGHLLIASGLTSSNVANYDTATANKVLAGASDVGTQFAQQHGYLGYQRSWLCVRKITPAASSQTWATRYARTEGTANALSDEHVIAVLQLDRASVPQGVLTKQGCINDICDAHQVHLIGHQWDFPNPWTGAVPASTSITPYHYWTAAAEVKAWRAANGGLADNTRPLLATQIGIDYLSQISTGRTDLTQLRRLKFGKLVLDALAYGCSLVNFHSLSMSLPPGFDVIDQTAVGAGISFVGAGAVVGSAANNTLAPLLPPGLQQGDLLICVSYTRTNAGSHTSPWTTHSLMNVDPHYLLVSYKIASGSGIDTVPTITPTGVAADQSNIAVVMAFRGVDRTTPFDTPGANSTNAVAEDIGPIAAATALAVDGAVVVIGCRNATSTGGNVSVLSGDGQTWVEAADGGFATGFGCHLAVDYAIWSGTAPTLTAKTFDVAAGLTGAGCGKMLLLRPAASSTYIGSQGQRDADYAFQALDMRETSDAIAFEANQWQDYWKGWQVSFDAAQDPIDGDSAVCPFVEWNRVVMNSSAVTMAAGGRNELRRKKNLGRGEHTFSCDVKLSAAGSQAALRVSGHDKLNGLALVSSNVLSGVQDWTRLEVKFTPRQHYNRRIPDPPVCVLKIDHNGVGICELRNPRIDLPGKPTAPPPEPYFDLRVTDISWSPANPLENEQVSFTATIENIGTAPTPSGIIHGIRFDVDGQVTSWSDNNTTSLAAGASRAQTSNNGPGGLATWGAVLGTHTVMAYVDDVNRMPTEKDKANNTLTDSIIVASAPAPGIQPPPQAVAAGLTSLKFNDEFTSLDFYHPTTNPNGKWRTSNYYQGSLGGYVDFGGLRTFCINQTYPVAETQPYLPMSQLDSTTMRITCRRARLSERPALRAFVNNIAVNGQSQPPDKVTWLGAFLSTRRVDVDNAGVFSRPCYIEGRVRMTPYSDGPFSSFWTYQGTTSGEQANPNSGFQLLETTNLIKENYNVNVDQGPNGSFYPRTVNSRYDSFITVGVHWDATFMKAYLNNVLVQTFDATAAGFFNTPLCINITHTCDPHWTDPPLPPSSLRVPSNIEQMYFDYDWIRVWYPGVSTVNVFPATGTLATAYTVTAGGKDSPVYPVTINTWYRNNPNTQAPGGTEQERWDAMEAVNETAGFTAFELSGTSAPVAVRFNDRTVTSAKVYPVRHGITPTISGGNTVNFNVTKAGKYIVMINNTEVRACHVFVHPVDSTAPTGSGTGVVYYGPGTHNIGTVTVANNTTYYIAGGARVIGQFNCGARSGFKIKGRGVVQSASNFLVGDNATGFTVEGVTILRPLGTTSDWTFKPRSATNFTIDGVNVFACEVTRDGIDTVSCRNYTVKNCFARTMDDPCCINAAFAGYGNIDTALLEDCVFMPDNGIGGLEIGASMECTSAQNITYHRIDMINPRIQCAISILNSDYADVNNVIYNDVHIDGFYGSVATGACWIGRFEARQTSFSADPYVPGQIRNIDLYNVTVINTPTAVAKLLYQGNSTYSVGPIRWHNLRVNGTLITSEGQITVSKPAFVGTTTYDTAAAP